ncbi:MAG: Hsp20/alpha crystallin family protein [Bacilli bacterium]
MNNWQHPFNDAFWGQFTQYFQRGLTSINVYEKDGERMYVFSLPGVESLDAIRIRMNGTALQVAGDIRFAFPDYKCKEEGIFQGAFTRDVEVPYPARTEDIRAVYRNGLLIVNVPRNRVQAETEPTVTIVREGDEE